MLLLLPSPPQLQIAHTALPMWIDPTTLSCTHDSHSKTGQMQGGDGHDEDQALEYFGRRELAGVELRAARFFITKARFNVEAQAILVASVLASVGSSLATNQGSSGWSSRQARAR